MPIRNISANEAWEELITRYNIESAVQTNGIFHITANQIKEYKEPRLMAKWDSSHQLPSALRSRKLNILPVSRGAYVIGDFLLYQEIPPIEERVERMTHVELPEYETINAENITSESTAIDALILSGILDDFLQDGVNASTFHGRMGTGVFDFKVKTHHHGKKWIRVNNAQCEIDGGFENDTSVVILEAKNVVHEDFHIRQLYYPYRLWEQQVQKPIRLVFSIYSNQIFRLFEYRFTNLMDYSSIELVKSKNYSLQDTNIEISDLISVRRNTPVVTDDNMEHSPEPPFIQANSMDRIVSLLENLHQNPMSENEIAVLMDFVPRQAGYYFNAGKYLGLFEKRTEENQKLVYLSDIGENIYRLNYKDRQLELVSRILEHKIFAELFDSIVDTGEFPSISAIEEKMRLYHVCNEGQINRRAGSVLRWLHWMINLTSM